jgi:A/G-specific adenine glycosylase
LKLWEGLGYYARARNLHSAARQIVRENRGIFPNDLQTVSDLPGIGPYTAAAILSIAFDQDQAVVDGNVERVLARLLCIDVPPRSREGRKVFRQLAENLLARGKAGIYNQALMELGALVCRPRKSHLQQLSTAVFMPGGS